LLKVEGGNTELGGDLSVSGTTRLNTLEVGNNVGMFDTILIRRTDATGRYINLRTLQVYANNINILPSATNATQSVESGSLGDVIEFMTWDDLVAGTANISKGASNIRNNNITDNSIHNSSSSTAYISLYIPLTQSFNISDIQSFVLYNRSETTQVRERINGFQIELYNRTNGFTPGTNVLYSMSINTTANVYRFDLPAITSYTGGFSTTDSQTKIKDITVSASTQNFDTTLLKVSGGNVFIGGQLYCDLDAFHYSAQHTLYTKGVGSDVSWITTIRGSTIKNSDSFRPKYTGKYSITLCLFFTTGSAGQVKIGLKLNGSEYNLNSGGDTYIVSANSANRDVNMFTGNLIVDAVAGEDIKAYVIKGTLRYWGSHSYLAGYYIGNA